MATTAQVKNLYGCIQAERFLTGLNVLKGMRGGKVPPYITLALRRRRGCNASLVFLVHFFSEGPLKRGKSSNSLPVITVAMLTVTP